MSVYVFYYIVAVYLAIGSYVDMRVINPKTRVCGGSVTPIASEVTRQSVNEYLVRERAFSYGYNNANSCAYHSLFPW